jgi:hypothetical protein
MAQAPCGSTPQANVNNITSGFNAQQTGTMCSKTR